MHSSWRQLWPYWLQSAGAAIACPGSATHTVGNTTPAPPRRRWGGSAAAAARDDMMKIGIWGVIPPYYTSCRAGITRICSAPIFLQIHTVLYSVGASNKTVIACGLCIKCIKSTKNSTIKTNAAAGSRDATNNPPPTPM